MRKGTTIGTTMVSHTGASSAPIRAARKDALVEDKQLCRGQGSFGTSRGNPFAHEETIAARGLWHSELATAEGKACIRGTSRQIQSRLQLRAGLLKREGEQSWPRRGLTNLPGKYCGFNSVKCDALFRTLTL